MATSTATRRTGPSDAVVRLERLSRDVLEDLVRRYRRDGADRANAR